MTFDVRIQVPSGRNLAVSEDPNRNSTQADGYRSSNETGTTFTVDRKDTAFQVIGGDGDDTLQATTFAFTAEERESTFATTLIETIEDTSGVYTINDPLSGWDV